MKTILIQVDEARPGAQGGYPVALQFDDGSGPQERATGMIPADLGVPPNDPNGDPLDPDGIVRLLLGESETATFGDIGRYLYGLLAESGIGDEWTGLRSTHRAKKEGEEPLLTLIDVQPAGLAALPWELMAESTEPLFLDRFNPSMRGSPRDAVVPDMPPLRLLVVVGDKTAIEEETVEILAALNKFRGTLECHVLAEPTPDELVTAVTTWQPHIFHFTGHAAQPPGSDGYLQIGPQGAGWQLKYQDVSIGFQGHAGRLAVLNACRTAQGGTVATPKEARQATASMATAFHKAGFPAVIGMQADIETGAATRFGTALYTNLAKALPLPLAVAQARFETWGIFQTTDRRDWALPALTVSAAPDDILAIRDCLAGLSSANKLKTAKEFQDIATFVNQHEQRRAAWLALDPEGFLGRHPTGLVVVNGTQGVGKSWLIYHCLRVCVIRGRLVRLVDLAGESPLSFLDVLRAIKDGTNPALGGSPLRDPLPPESFSSFNHALQQVLTGAGAFEPYQPSMGVIADPGGPFDRAAGDVEKRAAILVERFVADVATVATAEPLIVALDRLDGVEPADFTNFIQPLLRMLAEADNPQVRVIVALTPDQREKLWSADLDSVSTPVNLAELKLERWPWLFTEYLLATGTQWPAVKKALDVVGRAMDQPTWKPSDLSEFASFAKKFSGI